MSEKQPSAELLTVAEAYMMLRQERQCAEVAATTLRDALGEMNAATARLKALVAELRQIFGSDKKRSSPLIQ
jgi:hypothetical protein